MKCNFYGVYKRLNKKLHAMILTLGSMSGKSQKKKFRNPEA